VAEREVNAHPPLRAASSASDEVQCIRGGNISTVNLVSRRISYRPALVNIVQRKSKIQSANCHDIQILTCTFLEILYSR